jgi:hypothetical protein
MRDPPEKKIQSDIANLGRKLGFNRRRFRRNEVLYTVGQAHEKLHRAHALVDEAHRDGIISEDEAVILRSKIDTKYVD